MSVTEVIARPRPDKYRGKRRKPLNQETATLIGAALIYVTLLSAGIVMTAVA